MRFIVAITKYWANRSLLTAVYLAAGGVDDLVLDSVGQQEAMQPETVAPCLEATDHGSMLRQAESFLGSLDLQDQVQRAAGGDRLEPGLWPRPTVQASFQSRVPRSRAR